MPQVSGWAGSGGMLAELRRSPILRSWTYALRASANFGIELAPIGSDYECETGTDPPSSRETSTLSDKGGSPCLVAVTPLAGNPKRAAGTLLAESHVVTFR